MVYPSRIAVLFCGGGGGGGGSGGGGGGAVAPVLEEFVRSRFGPSPKLFSSFLLARQHADLRQDVCREDDHARCGGVLHDRRRQSEDPSQGGHPSRRTAARLVR